MTKKRDGRERLGERARPVTKKSIERGDPTTTLANLATKLNRPTHTHTARRSFTIIDCLLARALAYCLLDLDYTEVIGDARRLAACTERRRAI